MNLSSFKQRFSPKNLFGLFLISAFPFHLWMIIMLIRDYGWITQRSGVSSFTGVASLAMIYALAESVLFFVILLLLGLLIPWNFSVKRVFTMSGFLALWIPLWDMLAQIYRGIDFANPDFFLTWLFNTGHPVRYGYPILILTIFAVIGLTTGLIWLVSFNQKFQDGFAALLERIQVLTVLYLVLDIISFVIAAARIIG